MRAIEKTAPGRGVNAGRPSKTGLPGPAFALILIAPCLLLSVAVIGYPIFDVIRMSLFDVSRTGVVREFAGLANFAKAFADPVFLQAARQTLVWTVAVVGGTLLISVPIALILNEDFYGRTIARTIVLLPWAISLAMTAVVWRYVVNGDFGTLNMTLAALGLPFENYPWLADARMAFLLEILVGILVSVPFTVTILLGGLTSIPESLYEASAIDGASSTRSFYYITMPLLWPFMQIALVLNVIYVFNSFPIIWIMTNGGPANRTDILITYVYKQAFAFGKLGNAAAGSVVMFAMLLVFAVVYLFLTKAQGARNDV
ncbi:carbohydrate ABC transporter permease [Aminobacter sp. HY435]|uniref:carbohydrate ABC transporter permease n=1 Tax=Aminobacter sp. HY435 TaxID=2970917 RepID=UPI0022B96EBD|nr:sugar ABC transporter permease [Aminobacter sp. HY435]